MPFNKYVSVIRFPIAIMALNLYAFTSTTYHLILLAALYLSRFIRYLYLINILFGLLFSVFTSK